MSSSRHVPKGLFVPSGAHYSNVLSTNAGQTVWLAGQVGWDDAGRAPSGIRAQTKLAFKNVENCLLSAGATLQDVVSLTVYVTDPAYLATTHDVRKGLWPHDPPVSTGLVVVQLARSDLLVEIQAIAVRRPHDRLLESPAFAEGS